jgi:amino acid adenylation domain-containing protein
MLTADLRSQITDRKAELLTFLRDESFSASSVPPPIPRRVSKDPTPLSFAQERLWFLEQLEPGSAVYNICRASRLTGKLNIAALEASLTELLGRNEMLRSEIRIVDGRPVQVAVAVSRFELPVIDLRSLNELERDREVRHRIKAEAEWQFDFSEGLFFRAVLLQISNEQHILILTTHHIVADAWSMGILTKEIWTRYDAYANGKPVSLPELPVQYADYAAWQREWLQGEALEGQFSYWRKQLDSLPVLSLPTDHPRPAKQSFHGARVPITLPQSLTTAVNELSGREGVTQFMTLLAAFQVLLYRYSGQEDVVVGSPISNRSRTETEELIGFFVNTLVLRADLSEKPTFKELLQRVRNVCLQAYAHQDLPFEKLVEELRPERDLSRNPLFQVMFVLQNTPRILPQPAGLSIERVDVLPATSPFDLSLYLRERDGKIIGFFEYNTDLFESLTLERMVGHLQTLLEGVVADPGQAISTLPLLTEAERHQVLVEWNNTETEYPKDVCIHELFEAQAATTPESIALEFEGRQLTYRELNRRANQLAHYLRGLGIGPEKLVGICVERSLEMVIGLLGILKAGGAYVPLDPAYPTERLAFILEDAQVSVLLTQEALIEDKRSKRVLSEAEGIEDSDSQSSILDPQMKMICLDRDREKIAQQSERNPDMGATARNLAYVIYTSGSTGQPKGVQIEHRSVINCLYSMREQIGLAEKNVMLAVTTISFDIAALENFLPLTTGAKLVLASRDDALDGRQLLDRLTECDATVTQATPSAWKLLLDAAWRSSPDFKILCGGEVLSRDLADQLLEGGASLWNLYGPTETTIWSTIAKIDGDGRPVLIGRPIANTEIYILDSQMQPVPVGVHGELYIGGDGLARGYLNRPELTAERFVANPFSSQLGARLYRTGDRACYRANGNIEFLGRVDNQVKIRGYRIELGEIEAVLTKHLTVKDCVVVVCEHVLRTGKNLVGYVVPREHSGLSVTELLSYLKEKLPEYMIPSSFVVLEALPLMPNGKVDRNNLPPPDGTRPFLTKEFISPRTEIEELIAQTWREVLKIENVGIQDNFFELGGHSLLATQIVARLQEAFNKNVPLRVLFDAPTIAELAHELETIIRDGPPLGLPPIMPAPRDGPLPLSINQEHLWRLNQMMPGTHFFNMPYVYRLSGELNVEGLEQALIGVVRRHEALRTVFGEVNGNPVQIIRNDNDIKLIRIDLRALPNGASKAAAAHLLAERSSPFDLATGPLLRVKLLHLTETDSLLLVTTHHSISDHWSMQVFRGELVKLYEAFVEGRPTPLSKPTIQFGDYACWERQLLDTGQLDGHATYWKHQINKVRCQREIDTSTKSDSEFLSEYIRQAIDIDVNGLTQTQRLAKELNCTPFMVVMSAVFVMLYFMFQEPDIRIGTLVSNRRKHEVEGVIGHLLNTVIISARLSRADTFQQVVSLVRTASLAAYANQEYPFEQLARVLETKHKLERECLFRVLLNYQQHTFRPINAAGLRFASWYLPPMKSRSQWLPTKYDLIFDVKETTTSFTGTVNVRTPICQQSKAGNVNEYFQKVLKLLVSQPRRSLSTVSDECIAEA